MPLYAQVSHSSPPLHPHLTRLASQSTQLSQAEAEVRGGRQSLGGAMEGQAELGDKSEWKERQMGKCARNICGGENHIVPHVMRE